MEATSSRSKHYEPQSNEVEVPSESESGPPSSSVHLRFVLEYGILKIIFQYLGIRDLCASLRVCKLWNEVGNIVRNQRSNKPELFLYHLYSNDNERAREVVELSNGFQVSDSTISWVENPSTHPQQSELLRRDVRARTLYRDLEPTLWHKIDKNQFSEPCQIIFVGTQCLAPYLQLRKATGEESSASVSKIDLFRRMGKVCPCIGLLGYGLVLTLPDNSLCLENECRSRGRFLPMLSGIALPKVKGLKVTMFSVGSDSSHSLKSRKVTPESCEQLLNIQAADNVKGIILFQPHQSCPVGENLLLSAVHKYLKKNPNVAFGGGLFNEAFTNDNSGKLIGCGLVISGDETVRVGSTAFLDEGVTENNLKNLRKFKDSGMMGTTDYAFMFCCNGRGFLMHNAEHVESTLFRSEYPNVPLIGAFTGGEYFHPFVPGQSSPALAPASIKDLKFGYTTVFVYVSSR